MTKTLFGATKVTAFVGALSVFLMMIHITLDVSSRYVLSRGLPGTLVIVSQYYMVAVAFLALGYAELRDKHIRVELLTDRFNPIAEKLASIFSHVLSAVIFAMLAYAGFNEAMGKYWLGAFIMEQNTRMPVWPSYFLMPIGCGLMSLCCVLRLFKASAQKTRP